MKKLFSLLLAVLVSASCLVAVGCGGKTSYDPDNFLTLEEATALGTPNKIVKNPVTIKIFVPRGSMNPSYSEMRMFKVLSEETNLKFEFIEAAEDQYMTIRSTAWENKADLPDLFLYNNTISEIVMYSAQGALTPFNDASYSKNGLAIGSLIDNYMPNYKALLDSNFNIEGENAKEILTIRNGLMYSAASVNDVPRDLSVKLYINQKWISLLNEQVDEFNGDNALPDADNITTIEEYLRVLRAFKKYGSDLTGYYGGNGEIVPVTSNSMNDLRNMFMAAYGHVSEGIEINNQGTAFEYTAATDAYREYLKFANTLYKEGLMDESTFSNSSTMINNKGYEGRLGSFTGAAAYIVVGTNKDADYTTTGPFTSSYYTGTPLWYSFQMIDALGAVIPSSTNYSREVARLLDIMYSDLGVTLSTFGQENVDWKWDDDDKTSWSRIMPEDWTGTSETYRATLTPSVGLGVSLYNKYEFVKKDSSADTSKLNVLSERYQDYLKNPIPAKIKLTKEQYNRESLIGTSLESKVKEWEFSFIKGTKDPNKDGDWNEYLSVLSGYNYTELVAIYNDALAKA